MLPGAFTLHSIYDMADHKVCDTRAWCQLFLNVMKREKDQSVRDELKRRVSHYLDRAETLKQQVGVVD